MSIIVITGISGYLGRYLLPHLEQDNDYDLIVAIDCVSPPMELSDKTQFMKIDIDNSMIVELIANQQVDTVIHLAFAVTPLHNPEKVHEINVIGTTNVLRACELAKVKRLLVLSSTAAYGPDYRNPSLLTERSPLRGKKNFQFANDKVEIEKLCHQYFRKHPKCLVTILRSCTVIGPGVDNFITRYLDRLFVPTLLGYDPLMQFVHIEDLVDACLLVLKSQVSGVYNVVGEGVLPLSSVIKLAGKIPLPIIHFGVYPLAEILWYLRISEIPSALVDYIRYSWIASGEKIAKELGFIPRYSSKDALLSYVESQRVDKLRKKSEKEELQISQKVSELTEEQTRRELDKVKQFIRKTKRVND